MLHANLLHQGTNGILPDDLIGLLGRLGAHLEAGLRFRAGEGKWLS